MKTDWDDSSPRADSARPAYLKLEACTGNGEPELRLTGEIDMASAPLVERTLRAFAQTGAASTLDLSGLTYCDSQGINMFFRVADIAREHGGNLTLAQPSDIVRRVFEIVDIEVDERGQAVLATSSDGSEPHRRD